MSGYQERYRDFRWQVPEHFNFGAAIDTLAADGPAQPAALGEDRDGNRVRLCFADVRDQSNRIANVLAGLEVRPGEAVMVALPRITLWQAAYVGALKAGAIVVPCDAALRDQDLVFRANHCGAVAIIAAVGGAAVVGSLRSQCPTLRHYIIAGSPRSGWLGLRASMASASPNFTPVRTRAADPALCLYTLKRGGGAPLAALHSHAHVWSHRYTGEYWLGLRPGELHWTTAEAGSARGGWGVMFGPWLSGASTFIYNGALESGKLMELLCRYPIRTLCATAEEYRRLAAEDFESARLAGLRHCTATGEALSAQTVEAFRDRFGLIIHDGYGQAEAAMVAANLPGMEVRAGSLGRPFPGHDLRVLAGDEREAADGEVGEIAIRVRPERPPSLMLEYWRSPSANAAAFRGDYYLTGDLASRDGDGYLWFAGRRPEA